MSFEDLPERVSAYQDRIAAITGDARRVRIVGVTKTFGPEAVRAARDAGLGDIGENYAQESAEKHELLVGEDVPQWHFIGQLQTNKVKLLAPFVDVWQSIDRPSLIRELAKRAPGASVLIQVDLTDDPSRGGVSWGDVHGLVENAREMGLDVRGLMAVGLVGEPEDSRQSFRRVRQTANDLELPDVSMGMTEDFEVAVQEGSTMIRLGRALFGPRR